VSRPASGPWLIVLAIATACAGIAGYETAPVAGHGDPAPVTLIAVTAGKPSELAFRLSRSSFAPWPAGASVTTVKFRVTNGGVRSHDFKVCTTPGRAASANACSGKATRLLGPGRSETLTVSFKRRGLYEYLSIVPGEAAGGMKGLVGVGIKPPPATQTTPVTTTTTTALTTTTEPSSLVGNANSGKPIFTSAGCGSCHTLAAAGASSTVGPSLDATKPTQPVIVQAVTDGGTVTGSSMPAYAGTLTPTQIDDLAAYVYLTTHTIN